MTAPTHMSMYERRIKLVQDVLTEDSKLSNENARDLAVRVLGVLDRIPENVR